jgi:hypothetical protein
MGIISVDFYVTDQLHKRYSTLNRDWMIQKGTVQQLIMNCKKGYDSFRREVCTIFSLSLVSYATSYNIHIFL